MPPSTSATSSAPPTNSAPAALAAVAASPSANTAIRTVFPVPPGSETVPRTIWSAFAGFTPS